jgi:hypothetical protein
MTGLFGAEVLIPSLRMNTETGPVPQSRREVEANHAIH